MNQDNRAGMRLRPDANFERKTKNMGRRRRTPIFSSSNRSDCGDNSMVGGFFPNSVVQAMTLLDECEDNIDMAQMLARMQMCEEDLETATWWGEVFEALRVNQRNLA